MQKARQRENSKGFFFSPKRLCEKDQANCMQVLYYECQTAAESHK